MNNSGKVDMLSIYRERENNLRYTAHVYIERYLSVLINYFSLYDFWISCYN